MSPSVVTTQTIEFLGNEAAADRVERDAVRDLTTRAVQSTYFTAPLTKEQVEANLRISDQGVVAFWAAASSSDQHLVAALSNRRLAGFMIATRHGTGNLELDWMMVDPDLHGTGISRRLMLEGIDWLGPDRPIWLTVLKSNARAIAFYQKFGFEIDPTTELDRIVPTWVMRRPGEMTA